MVPAQEAWLGSWSGSEIPQATAEILHATTKDPNAAAKMQHSQISK